MRVDTSSIKRVGFVGTGIMGAPMAANLAAAGFEVACWNRTAEKAARLTESGIRIAATPGDAIADADIVISMLSDGDANDRILFDDDGAIVPMMRNGALLIVMSSIPVATAKAQAQRAHTHRVSYLDAPVSGGEGGARAASLSIMVGGTSEIFERARPVLEAMGRPVLIGEIGAGQLCKLVNQLIVACNLAALAEALTLAQRGGADPSLVLQALSGGFADSTILQIHGRRMAKDDFEPGGPAKYQLKDTRAAKALASELDLDLPVLGLVDSLFERMVEAGDGDLDHSGVIRQVRREAALAIAG